ncbi:MAG: hypothetical protein MPW16_10445 [Candidatus Manganitrophus sp.]|nr:MAG: hypothetical protein MPW16_10445 [Candidatus Manganitrophus sp.]
MAANLPKQSTRLGIPFILLCLLIALQGCGGKSHSPEGDGFFRKESDTEIRFERSGGVAGIRTISTIHSGSLPEEERKHLRSLIDRSGFFGLPEEIIGPPRPDEFLYAITIESDGKTHTVRTTDTTAPEQLKPLIEWLNETAGGAPGATG